MSDRNTKIRGSQIKNSSISEEDLDASLQNKIAKLLADTTYYVSTESGASDDNPGTEEEPFATIQHAIDMFPKNLNGHGAGIYLLDGTYNIDHLDIIGFYGGGLVIEGYNEDPELVTINATPTGTYAITIYKCHSVTLLGFSLKIIGNSKTGVHAQDTGKLTMCLVNLGDNANTGTIGIWCESADADLSELADIDAEKVAIGIQIRGASVVSINDFDTLGDTFKDIGYGLTYDGLELVKADYDDAITKKHDGLVQPTISTGTAAPSSTPDKVGDIYIDTNNKKLYFAVGTSSSANWEIAN